MSPEDFAKDHSPISSNENSRGSWNNGRRPRSPPEPHIPPPVTGPRTPPMPMRGARTPEGPGPRTPEGKGARTPETPPEDNNRSFKPRDVKRPSTPPEPYPETDMRSPGFGDRRSPPSMTAALEKAYRHPPKGPRTPPDFSPRGGPVSPPEPAISPRSKRRRTPPPVGEYDSPPHKRRRSRDRSHDRSRSKRSSDRDRYDDRRRSSRSPPRRRGGRDSLDRSPPRSRRRTPSPPSSRSSRGSRRRSPDRSSNSGRDRGGSGRASRDREPYPPVPERSVALGQNSLFAEIVKNKQNRQLIQQKQNLKRGETSMIVNSELQDPRSHPQASNRPPNMPPQPHSRGGSGQVTSNGQTNPMINQKKGVKPPPHRPGALAMPPDWQKEHQIPGTSSGTDSPNISGSQKKSSKLLNMPMPPIGEEEDSHGGSSKRRKRKPKVIGKPLPTKMSEDGSEWGERNIDIYEIVDKVGEGTYGEVFKSVLKSEFIKNNNSGQGLEQFALKKVRLENEKEGFPITAVREIKILRQLKHKNIINLKEIGKNFFVMLVVFFSSFTCSTQIFFCSYGQARSC